jgi:branched-chain amino acid transport system substrate-binding protein
MLGGDGWDSERLYEVGGPALDGSYFSNHYAPDDPNPVIQTRIKHFNENYSKAYGAIPDSLAAQAYDAAGMLASAMKRAKDLTGPSIRDALATTKDYPGVTGDITMDQHRNPMKSAVVVKIAPGGKFQYVTRVQPEGTAAPGAPSAQAGQPGAAPSSEARK